MLKELKEEQIKRLPKINADQMLDSAMRKPESHLLDLDMDDSTLDNPVSAETLNLESKNGGQSNQEVSTTSQTVSCINHCIIKYKPLLAEIETHI